MSTNGFIDQAKKILIKNRIVHRLYLANRNFKKRNKYGKKQMDMIYQYEDLRPDYYEKIKTTNERELEHQVGRLMNWKRIIAELEKMEGDLVEFGSWRGFSLLWQAFMLERQGIFNKKLFGMDSFAGIPYPEGVFEKHAFSDTSLQVCAKNVYGSTKLFNITKNNIFLGKYFYHETKRMLEFFKRNNASKFCFVHVDCDVSKSAEEIFKLLMENDLLAPKVFLLFDDYGCVSNIHEVIDKFVEEIGVNWEVQIHSQTNLTKNYLLIKK